MRSSSTVHAARLRVAPFVLGVHRVCGPSQHRVTTALSTPFRRSPCGASNIVDDDGGTATLETQFDPRPRLFEASLPMDIAYPVLWLASDEAVS